MQPERGITTATNAATLADLAAILRFPGLTPLATTLWAALFVAAGGRPGTLRIDEQGMAALIRREPRSLRRTKTTPGPVELLQEQGAIERGGGSVYVHSAAEAVLPRPHRVEGNTGPPLAGMPSDLDDAPPDDDGGVGAKSPESNKIHAVGRGGVCTNSPEATQPR